MQKTSVFVNKLIALFDVDQVIALLDVIVWPTFASFVVYWFGPELRNVLERLSELSLPGVKATMENEIEEAEEQAESVSLPEGHEGEAVESPINVKFSGLRVLAEKSPRAAILEAWGKVLESARRVANRARLNIGPNTTAYPLIELLHSENIVDSHVAALLHRLRRISKKAKGPATEYEVSTEDAGRFIRIAEHLHGYLINVHHPELE